MQDFSFLLGNDFKLPQIDIYAPYKQALTLRQLADAREYQKAQLRHMQLQEQDALRKQAAQERVRAALQTLPADADAMTMLRHLGPEGLPLVKELEDAKNATATRQTTEAGLQAKRRELTAAQKKDALNDLASIMAMPDPDLKGQRFMEWQGKNEALKLPLGRGVDWPLTPQGFEFAYKNTLGPDEWRKSQAEAAEAQHKAKLRPLEVAEKQAAAAHAQQVLTGQAVPSPSAAPALFHTWYGGWLLRNNKADSPENRSLGIEEYNRQTHPQFATPGVDVPYSPAVVAQKKELAAAAQENKPASADVQKKRLALSNYKKAIQAYRNELAATEPSVMPGKIPRLRALFTDLTLQAKEAANLGALAGPDMMLLQGLLTDPSSVSGAWVQGKDGLNAQLDVADAIAKRNEESLGEVYGTKGTGNQTQQQPAGNQPVQKWGRDKNGNPVRIP